MRVTIKTDFIKLLKGFDDLKRSQVPFAAAVTLTMLAKKARDKVKDSLSTRFTIRGSWVGRGIRFTPASKRDWPNQVAMVGSKDKFMREQETGGVLDSRYKLRVTNSKRDDLGLQKEAIGMVAIPMSGVRPTKKTTVPRRLWPNVLNKRKNVFIARTEQGQLAMMEGSGKTHKISKMLYLFRPNVKIKPRWQLQESVNDLVEKEYDATFGAALSKAIASRQKG